MDAEAAANSAAIQLVSFKDAMEDEFAVCLLQFCTHQMGSNMGLPCGKPEHFTYIKHNI